MGFRFRLQRVLRLAEVEEEVARSDYEKRVSLLEAREACLLRIDEERRRTAAALARPDGRTVEDLRLAEARLLSLNRRRDRQREEVEEYRKLADEARQTLKHRWAEREKLTRLRARLFHQHRLREERAAQLEMDNLVAARHGRDSAEGR